MRDGNLLHAMTGVAEEMLGRLASTLYCAHLIYTCCGLFFATGLLTMFRHSNYSLVPLLMGFANLAIAICSMIILHSMVRTGQVGDPHDWQLFQKINLYTTYC